MSIAFLCIAGMMVIGFLITWHRADDDFDLKQAFVDSVTGKIAIEKVAFTGAFLAMTWVLIHMTLQDKLTEWYVLAYTGPFALLRGVSQGLAVWKDIKKDA